MNIRVLVFLLIMLTATNVHGQETITEEQLLLNGYIDNSGQVLLTGYVTPNALSYMPFLNSTQYSFDNSTSQLYVVTDMLTSKSADNWSLNFSLDGYYTDYSVTFTFPHGSEITKPDIPSELNYQFEVKDDAPTLSIQGYRVVSPWIKVDYRLSQNGQSSGLTGSQVSFLLIGGIAVVAFGYYIRKKNKERTTPDNKKQVNLDEKTKPEPVPETQTEEIPVTGEMQKVIDTLSDKEKAIVGLLLKNGGSATQSDIRYETGIPKSSLTGILNALKRKNIIKKHEYGRTNLIEFSEWFLSEKELK